MIKGSYVALFHSPRQRHFPFTEIGPFAGTKEVSCAFIFTAGLRGSIIGPKMDFCVLPGFASRRMDLNYYFLIMVYNGKR